MIITQKHINNFKPTFLYIKQHSGTGKLYFGKTTRKNIEKYTGSGKHWTRHINFHGKDKVVTLWFCLFTDVTLLVDTALSMSNIMSITESDEWLNLKPENGLDGGSSKGFGGFTGKQHSPEHIEKLRKLGKERPITDNMRNSFTKRDNCGDKNGRALHIGIFNASGTKIFNCIGNIESVCSDNNLPFGALKLSYSNNGKPIFTSKSPGRLKDLSMLKYKGWFAKIISNFPT